MAAASSNCSTVDTPFSSRREKIWASVMPSGMVTVVVMRLAEEEPMLEMRAR